MSAPLKAAIRADGKSMYCGPAALMAVSGRSYEEVRALVNRVRGRKSNTGVIGMYHYEMSRCLERLGIEYRKATMEHRPTLNRMLKDRSQPRVDATIIVNLTSHYVTVKGHMLVDNHTDVPVYVWSGPHLRCRVKRYWVLYD